MGLMILLKIQLSLFTQIYCREMNPEKLDDSGQLMTTHKKVIDRRLRRTLRDRMVLMYNSFTDMSAYTSTSKADPNSKLKELQTSKSKRDHRNYSTARENTAQTKKVVPDSASPSKNILFTEQNIRRNSRLIPLKKESFLATSHHNLQFIKLHFHKSGGMLSPQKKQLTDQIDKLSPTFGKLCQDGEWEVACEYFINFFNYCVDLKLIKEFTISLLYLAELLLSFGAYKLAIYYYNQSRICAKKQNNYGIFIDSLIGLARCCSKVSLHSEGLIFLKKALEYAYFIGDREKQLLIYDQMGRKYYLMGQISQAHFYHQRSSLGGFEKQDSAVKVMVKTKVKQQEDKTARYRLTEIDRLFLVSLNLPIKSPIELECLGFKQSTRNTYTNELSRTFDPYGQPQKQVIKILKERFFEEQMPDPMYSQNEEHIRKMQQTKGLYPQIDFQLNRYLMIYHKKLNKNKNNKHEGRFFKAKCSLDKRIQQRLQMRPLSETWYQDMVAKIVRERNSNLSSLRNQILVRGIHRPGKLPIRFFNALYNCYFIEILFC